MTVIARSASDEAIHAWMELNGLLRRFAPCNDENKGHSAGCFRDSPIEEER
jgi:hypothetical protein